MLVRAAQGGGRPQASSGSWSTRATSTQLLSNRVYLGEAVHKGTAYPGEHEAIVPRALWDKVHAILREQLRASAPPTPAHRRRRC